MSLEIGRSIRNFVVFVAILVIMAPGVLAGAPVTDELVWAGNGADDDGYVEEIKCGVDESAPGRMMWIFNNKDTVVTNAELIFDGISYPPFDVSDGSKYKFDTPYISGDDLKDLLDSGDVKVTFTGTLDSNAVLTISHGCPEIPIPEFSSVFLPIAAILGLMFIFGRKREL